MKRLLLGLISVAAVSAVFGAVESSEVSYKLGDQGFRGVVVRDTSVSAERPGVLVVPEYWGVNDYAKRRAAMLAEMGYVAFVADMYGDGKVTTDSKQAGAWAGQVKSDRVMMRQRAQAALDQLKAQPGVDANRLAAIGYCFGGTTVLEMARGDMPVKGVVSFHGGLEPGNAPTAGKIHPAVLVLHGAADPHAPAASVTALQAELTKAGADWYLTAYGDAVHAFSNPDAGTDPSKGAAYNEKADKRSWTAMKSFLEELFDKQKLIATEGHK